MRTWLVVAATVVLAACGGGKEGGNTPNALAAQACDAETKVKLEQKIYEMDLAALAASMKDAPNGEHFLTAPVVIEPGMTSETKQIVECTVRFSEGKDAPDVVKFGFNW
jgi:hypothetical protein